MLTTDPSFQEKKKVVDRAWALLNLMWNSLELDEAEAEKPQRARRAAFLKGRESTSSLIKANYGSSTTAIISKKRPRNSLSTSSSEAHDANSGDENARKKPKLNLVKVVKTAKTSPKPK